MITLWHETLFGGKFGVQDIPDWRPVCAVSPRGFTFLSHIIGEGNGTPLQYSCLENPMDGGAGKAAVHGVAEGRTRLSDSLSLFTFMHWRRNWQPIPLFLPGEFQGWWSLVGCHLWGHTESDMAEVIAAAAAAAATRYFLIYLIFTSIIF